MTLAFPLRALAAAPAALPVAAAERDVCTDLGRAAGAVHAAAAAAADVPRDGRSGSDEPLDPRSTGWSPGKKSPLPWVLAIVGGVLLLTAASVGIYFWQDARARFPNDTLGVQTFRP